jgi:hypothetical protein
MAAGLAGCGGGGGGSQAGPLPPDSEVTISGLAGNDPVTNGAVRLESLNGTLLGQSSTDSEGSFSIQTTEGGIANGYSLIVTGGQVRDRSFLGEMRATYAGTEDRDTANVTLLTTLVNRMAELEASGVPLQRRDVAIQRITDLGAIEPGDWNAIEPSGMELERFWVAIAERGLDDVLDVLASQLRTGEFNESLLEFFPNMFGGVVAVAFGDDQNRISDFPGGGGTVEVNSIVTSTEPYSFALEAGPDWLTVDSRTGVIGYAIPNGASPGQLTPFSIRVTNDQTGLGRSIEAALFVIEPETLAQGSIGPEGGTIVDPWGEVAVEVEPGSAAVLTQFLIIRGRDAEGNVMLSVRVDGDPDVRYRLMLPDPEVMDANTPPGLTPSMLESQDFENPGSRALEGSDRTDFSQDLANPVPNRIDRGQSWYFSFTNKRVPYGYFSEGPGTVVFTSNFSLRTTWELWGPRNVVAANPVLFVHGYVRLNNLGGGQETWAHFPQLIADLDTPGESYQPYEFRWRSDVRFQDIAVDLATAVQRIASDTDQQVSIVAHSFGGIVVRSFLQGLSSVDVAHVVPSVASVTTVGTPHSGVFGADGGVRIGDNDRVIQFPDGRDTGLIDVFERCGQISCYQMGVEVDFTSLLRSNFRETLGLDDAAGLIAQRLEETVDILPDIPIQVLIGLTADRDRFSFGRFSADQGDALISFLGQRFLPSLGEEGLLGENEELNEPNFGLARVREQLLGYPPDIRPSVEVTDRWLSSNYREGYRHSRGERGSARQVGIECASVECEHDVWLKTRAFLVAVEPAQLTPTRFTVNGSVLNSTGQGVEGVRLTFAAGGVPQGSTTSDANGSFSTSLLFQPDTQYTVTAFPPVGSGYRAITSTGVLVTSSTPEASGNRFPTITLVGGEPTTATFSGEIRDAQTGNLLANAQYRVFNSLGVEVDSGLSTDGRVLVSDLPPGTYRLQASLQGYATGENPTCTVDIQQSTICVVSLSEVEPTTVLYVSGQGPLGGVDTVSIDPQTGAVRDGLSSNLPCCGFSDLEYVNGILYGVEDYASSLYEINIAQGTRVRIGGTGAICVDCDLISHDGRLYQVNMTGDVYEINLNSGLASPLNRRLPVGAVYAFDDSGVLWGIGEPWIYQIDFSTGATIEERFVGSNPYTIDGVTFTSDGLIGIDRLGGALLRIDLASGQITPFAVVEAGLAFHKGITSQ